MLHADRLDAGFLDKPKEVHVLRILHCAFGRMLLVSNDSPAHDIDPVQAIGASYELPVNKAPCLGEEELRRVRRLRKGLFVYASCHPELDYLDQVGHMLWWDIYVSRYKRSKMNVSDTYIPE
jgi:hypothetical protein